VECSSGGKAEGFYNVFLEEKGEEVLIPSEIRESILPAGGGKHANKAEKSLLEEKSTTTELKEGKREKK